MLVTHVITGLGVGGAETMLYKLVSATRAQGLSHSVVSLTDGGTYGPRFTADGVSVTCLGMTPGAPDPRALPRLVRVLRRDRPDVVQGWMYHANLLAGIAAGLAHTPVVWGIRRTDVAPRNTKRLTHWTNSLCARLSGVLPTRIVCCAESALRSHSALGYRHDRMVVIPNGFDLTVFAPDSQVGRRVRQELSIPEKALVVGLIARFHPDKDHWNYLSAARLVAQERPDALFVLAGRGVEWTNQSLSSRIDESGLRPRVRLLGARSDVQRLLPAMDVLASSSRSEGFPQVLGEAMACGVPCAATDCGDSRQIVGATGRIVRPQDPEALASAISELLALSPVHRAALGAAARNRISERYDLRVVARGYAALYAQVVSERQRAQPRTARVDPAP